MLVVLEKKIKVGFSLVILVDIFEFLNNFGLGWLAAKHPYLKGLLPDEPVRIFNGARDIFEDLVCQEVEEFIA